MSRTLRIAGVDEAGRGPLAGPVVAAAVVLADDRPLAGVCDSKRLSPRRRLALADDIRRSAHSWQIAWAHPAEIDTHNILQASLLAMARALMALAPRPHHAIVDGNRCPTIDGCVFSMEAVVGGDRDVAAVSAASILAKTYRDAWMLRYHERYPQYGFDRHKGYPTPAHLARLEAHGPSPIHRYTFAPVRRCVPVTPQPPSGKR